MDFIIEILITEWLPISSTGHMLLVDEFIKMNVSSDFKEMFFVVIQLGAILAVVVMFWNKMWPFKRKDTEDGINKKGSILKKDIWSLWFKTAFIIGLFQVLSIIPGTSRSGSTIIGSLLIGVSRVAAAEFTFFLAVPVMFGLSFIKLLKFGLLFTVSELSILLVGMAVAFFVSLLVMGYIKKHDFQIFGWYRIILGAVVLVYFLFR